jgi:hypothetical protein
LESKPHKARSFYPASRLIPGRRLGHIFGGGKGFFENGLIVVSVIVGMLRQKPPAETD